MVTRGDIYLADLSPVRGHEQGGLRPVLVIQNDVGNEHSSTTIVAAITSRTKRRMPVHVTVSAEESGLPRDSIILLEQIRTIDKERLVKKLGRLAKERMEEVNRALQRSLDLP
ncbi:PemK family transcriptional regulator [Candidatus Acetothermia bacterium]|nr:MAG: PemK family transcriptional regulator [Candidatus Acetothermia bacterium]HHK67049.1 type II toxin-antitoxin system PemK/MazF family toxin [Candidatus Acetothermia bacterium]